MQYRQNYFDWITLVGSFVTIGAGFYYSSFEALVAGFLLGLQSARCVAYSRYCEDLEDEIEHLEEEYNPHPSYEVPYNV